MGVAVRDELTGGEYSATCGAERGVAVVVGCVDMICEASCTVDMALRERMSGGQEIERTYRRGWRQGL